MSHGRQRREQLSSPSVEPADVLHGLRGHLASAGPLGVLLLIAAGCALYGFWPLFSWTPRRSFSDEASVLFDPTTTSPALIAALSVLILFLRAPRLRAAAQHCRPGALGCLAMIPGLGLFAWSHHTGALDLMWLAIVPIGLGAARLAYGAPLARALALPLLFLVFALPMPAALANQAIWKAQVGTLHLTMGALDLLGVGAMREGDQILTASHIFQVIETCSGVRLIYTLLFSSIVYKELMGTPRLHALVLFLLAPVVAFLMNTVRVLTIVLYPAQDTASNHTVQGIAVVVLGVLVLHGIALLLQKVLPQRTRLELIPRELSGHEKRRPEANSALGSALVAGAGLAIALLSLWLPRWQAPAHPTWRIEMPVQFRGWHARAVDVDRTFLGTVGFSRYIRRNYTKDDGLLVETFVGLDDRLQRDRSGLSFKTALPGSGWTVHRRDQRHAPWLESGEVEEIVASHRGTLRLIWHWREGTWGTVREILRNAFALDNSFLRAEGSLRAFRVSTVVRSPSDRALREARARLEEFAPRFRGSIERS